MQLKTVNYFKQITIIGLVLLIFVASFPMEAHAAPSKTKAKKKYTVTIKNANSDTVLKKGSRRKLRCTINAKKNKKTKIKIKYRSSNPRIATISRKGVIKARKNGRTNITATVYVNGKKKRKKTITIRVGKPVSSISLSGHTYLRAGKYTKLKIKIGPKKVTNKKIVWTSSNRSAVSVDKKGKIFARGNGKATITAMAADGSGVKDSITVYSHKYTRKDARWIAHMGLHDTAMANTAMAFVAAGQSGFWGCECDIYETKHDIQTVKDENGNPVLDEDGRPIAEENFGIVINHDDSFKKMYGVDASPRELTERQIKEDARLKQVCFFEDYLKICKKYNMVPVIEIKSLSDKGLEKMVDIVQEQGLLEKGNSQFISFHPSFLEKAKRISHDKYNIDIYSGYLMIGNNLGEKVEEAHKKNFDSISIYYDSLDDSINQKCISLGVKIGTWTYGDSAGFYKKLYEHVVLRKYAIETFTTDGAMFN